MNRHAVAIVMLVGASLATTATAAVIDFEIPEQFPGNDNPGDGFGVLGTQGFNFISSADHFHAGFGLTTDPDGPLTGSLLEDIDNAIITMSRTAGGSFSITSFAAAQDLSWPAPTIVVTGQLSGGGSVQQSFSLTNSYVTNVLSGFAGLTSVTFRSTGAGSTSQNFFYLDNIDSPQATPNAVPLPAAAGLLLAGLAALGRVASKRVSRR